MVTQCRWIDTVRKGLCLPNDRSAAPSFPKNVQGKSGTQVRQIEYVQIYALLFNNHIQQASYCSFYLLVPSSEKWELYVCIF